MHAEPKWSKEAFEHSVSSLCWSWTPYDDGWEASLKWGGDIPRDEELREIVGMEAGLGSVPDWARRVVVGPMNSVAACGHIPFPLSYRDVVRAIGTGDLSAGVSHLPHPRPQAQAAPAPPGSSGSGCVLLASRAPSAYTVACRWLAAQ